MADKWDVEEIRALMPVVAAESEVQAIHDGYDDLDAEQIKFAKRFSDSWENASKRATSTDPSLLIIKNHLEDALAQLEQCTYYDPTWTYAQSKPTKQGIGRGRQFIWLAIDASAVGIVLAFIAWMCVR